MTSTEKKLVCGVGVNDADYVTQKTKPDHSARYVNGKYKQKLEYLGLFTCEQQAHNAWLKRKLELARLLAAEQTDPRVVKH